MEKDKQIIAIAEICGWTKCEHVKSIGLTKGFPPKGFIPIIPFENGMCQIPDYTTDLNAMHKAEKLAKLSGTVKYYAELVTIAGASPIHATAAQRAEAFLRTINLWEN